ncbi:MAG: TVP38/TMEM64 family protein [Xenococcaceae cyanobacterium]
MKQILTPHLPVKTRQCHSNCSRVARKKLRLLKNPRFWLAIALGGLAFLCAVGPLKVVFDQDFLVQQLQAYRSCAVILFILTYTILTVIGVPGTVLTIAGGLVFGLFCGTLWSVIGATLGALGAFWTARYLLRDYAERKFGKHKALVRFNQAVADKPIIFVLAVRFAPISPFNVVNFLFGLTPIHWVSYTFATFFGIIPGTLAYTWLGVSGSEALQGGDRLPFFIALGFLTLLSVLPIFARKKYGNRKHKNRKWQVLGVESDR